MSEFYIVEPGSRWPWSWHPNMSHAAEHLAELMLAEPQRWAPAGLMTCHAYTIEHDRYYLDQPAEQITAERFDEMLNVLPPLAWTKDSGVERFNMSEFQSGDITSQYGACGGRYLHKYVRHGDKATYLTPAHFQSLGVL